VRFTRVWIEWTVVNFEKTLVLVFNAGMSIPFFSIVRVIISAYSFKLLANVNALTSHYLQLREIRRKSKRYNLIFICAFIAKLQPLLIFEFADYLISILS